MTFHCYISHMISKQYVYSTDQVHRSVFKMAPLVFFSVQHSLLCELTERSVGRLRVTQWCRSSLQAHSLSTKLPYCSSTRPVIGAFKTWLTSVVRKLILYPTHPFSTRQNYTLLIHPITLLFSILQKSTDRKLSKLWSYCHICDWSYIFNKHLTPCS